MQWLVEDEGPFRPRWSREAGDWRGNSLHSAGRIAAWPLGEHQGTESLSWFLAFLSGYLQNWGEGPFGDHGQKWYTEGSRSREGGKARQQTAIMWAWYMLEAAVKWIDAWPSSFHLILGNSTTRWEFRPVFLNICCWDCMYHSNLEDLLQIWISYILTHSKGEYHSRHFFSECL